ncbi:MAG: TerB family tellurite resistance protein [Planctomycetes bacterium]|nr:TerB family tellurite resistance protein [Planctomycetota bacterium]
MFDGHRLLRLAAERAGAISAIGFLVAWAASFGFGRRRWRNGHLPWELGEYSTLEWIGMLGGLGVGLVAFFAWWGMRLRLDHLTEKQDYRFFLRAGAPRTIHGLLLAVASRDGTIDLRERDVVNRILLRDLPEGVVPQDLRNWTVRPDLTPPVAAATQLARILSPSERMAVLRWCREVAAADGGANPAETQLLRDIARILSGK